MFAVYCTFCSGKDPPGATGVNKVRTFCLNWLPVRVRVSERLGYAISSFTDNSFDAVSLDLPAIAEYFRDAKGMFRRYGRLRLHVIDGWLRRLGHAVFLRGC